MSDETYTPKVFEQDASQDQRALYLRVCDDLDANPIVEEPIPAGDQVTISCRCARPDRRNLNDLAREMGITRNALLLTAARMGMEGIREARAERLGES